MAVLVKPSRGRSLTLGGRYTAAPARKPFAGMLYFHQPSHGRRRGGSIHPACSPHLRRWSVEFGRYRTACFQAPYPTGGLSRENPHFHRKGQHGRKRSSAWPDGVRSGVRASMRPCRVESSLSKRPTARYCSVFRPYDLTALGTIGELNTERRATVRITSRARGHGGEARFVTTVPVSPGPVPSRGRGTRSRPRASSYATLRWAMPWPKGSRKSTSGSAFRGEALYSPFAL